LTTFNVRKRETNSRNQGAIFVPALAREILYWINSTELEVLAVFVWITFLTSGAYQIVHVPQPDWYCPSPIKSSQSHSHRNASNVPALTVSLSNAFKRNRPVHARGNPYCLAASGPSGPRFHSAKFCQSKVESSGLGIILSTSYAPRYPLRRSKNLLFGITVAPPSARRSSPAARFAVRQECS
jgi:hypothetical protein